LAIAFWLRLSIWPGDEWPLLIPGLITAIALILFIILGMDEDKSAMEGRTRPYSVYTESKGPASPRSHDR